MTPGAFIAKWAAADLTERSAAQQHFLDLCELLGEPKPAEADSMAEWYAFEKGASKTGGGSGWADVWKRGHFGWEYKPGFPRWRCVFLTVAVKYDIKINAVLTI